MLTYTFSRREKILILVMAIILVVVAWYMLVFQRTTNEITRLEGEISTTQSQITIEQGRLAQMNAMKAAIEQYKASGVAAHPVPNYDNVTAVMSELNAVLARTAAYSLSFDALDRDTSSEYVLRGVRADYTCDSMATAESVVTDLANGPYPCSIDSVSITDGAASSSRVSSSGTVSASIHITYFEKK